jgi:hypothetical protein
MDAAFMPTGPTFTVAASGTVAYAQLPPQAGYGQSLRVFVPSGAEAYLRFTADTTQAATVAASMPLAGGSAEVFRIPDYARFVSVILGTGTASIRFTPGQGM